MPINYSKYPSNWKKEIVPLVKSMQNNCCAFCGVKNYQVGYRQNGVFVPTAGNALHDRAGNGELSYKEARELVSHCNNFCDDNLIVIVLTVAHLNHDVTDNSLSNLKALCQKCHLDYDKEFHKNNARKTFLNKKRLTELPFPHDS